MDSIQRVSRHVGEQKKIEYPGVTLTVVNAGHNQVGWHCHPDPHFTLILEGHVIEGTRQGELNCSAGNLLFHGRFEPHYNVNLKGSTRCLHIGFNGPDLDGLGPEKNRLKGIFSVANAGLKLLCYRAFKEALLPDDVSAISIQDLTMQMVGQLLFSENARYPRPSWVEKLEEMLRSGYAEKMSLAELSRELSIHPVHLSRSCSQYFHCNLGEYIRKVRVERSLALMACPKSSLTEIAFNCGFADQSHFSRSFRRFIGVTPSSYRKLAALGR